MKIIVLNNDAMPVNDGCVVALGYFDGVHLGHLAVLNRAVSNARKMGLASAVWTFHTVASRGGIITTDEEKLQLFADAGIDYALCSSFDDIRGMDCNTFVRDVLINQMHARGAVCGFNFTFGAGGTGNGEQLVTLMKQYGGFGEVVGGVVVSGHTVSSTLIRAALSDGDIPLVNILLGRNHFVTGSVIHGRHIGTGIGMPTLNLDYSSERASMAHGVYVTQTEVNGQTHRGISNLGVQPTVSDEGRLLLETHLFDNAGDLYGCRAKVEFRRFLRPERRFNSLDELRSQIEHDISEANRCT